jgi:DNA-binding winged helix-turn-helix (wHTH) protein
MQATDTSQGSRGLVRFGVFRFDLDSGELWRHEHKVRLQDQPARILALLLERPGVAVTRDRLRAELWPSDTFVEFDTGLNSAVRKLRYALGESADNPVFIETLPKVGYRFIAPVQPPSPSLPSALPATEHPPPSTPTEPISAEPRRSKIPWRTVVLATVVLLTGFLGGLWLQPRTAPQPALRTALTLPDQQHLPSGIGPRIGITPDGKQIYYVADRQGVRHIFRRALSETTSESIPGTEGADAIFVSPAGNQLVFARNGQLLLLNLNDSSIRSLASVGRFWGYATVGSDGFLYYANEPTGRPGALPQMFRLPLDGGTPEQMGGDAIPGRGDEFKMPQQVLPDGRLLFTAVWGPRDRGIFLRDLKSGSTERVQYPAMGGLITPDNNHLIYFWSGKLFAARWQGGKMAGQPKEIASGVAPIGWSGRNASVSANGILVYAEARPPAARTLVWVDLAGNETPVPIEPGPWEPLDVSPDRQSLLLARVEPDDLTSIWVFQPSTGLLRKIHDQAPASATAVWAPDGQSFLVNSYQGDLRFPNILEFPVTESARGKRLSPSDSGQFPMSWQKGGPIVFVRSTAPKTLTDIGLLEPNGKVRILLKPLQQITPALSPDGRMLAYSESDDRVRNVLICALPACETPVPVQGDFQGTSPIWSPDGRTLYYRREEAVLAASVSESGGRIRVGPGRVLFTGNYAGGSYWSRMMALSPDGRRFLLAKRTQESEPVRRIQMIVNYPALLP